MTVTVEQIAELRRRVNEATTDTYTDALLQSIIEKYPMIDELGTKPYEFVQTGGVPTKSININWIPTYDLNASASQVWQEKAATVAANFDFTADGGNFTQSQEYIHAISMARFFLARASVKTITQIVSIDENAYRRPSWIGNLPEVD